jgi:hypothetical protein
MIKVKIADIPMGIDNRYDYLCGICKDYFTEEEPALILSATDSEIDAEFKNVGEGFSRGYLEGLVIYRKIASRLYEYDGFVFHGAVLNYRGKACIFTARSGVGKTTHTRLWLSEFGDDVHYLNGDKPIIRIVDGQPYAYGTPWQGKENYGVNEKAPLGAVYFLERAEENSVEKTTADESAIKFVTQMFVPKEALAAAKTLSVADAVLCSVKLFNLRCNMQPGAARMAKAALTEN